MLDFGGVYNVHSNLNVDKLPGFNVYAGQLESKKAAPGALLQCLWFQRNLKKKTKINISNKSVNKVENSTVLFEYEP